MSEGVVELKAVLKFAFTNSFHVANVMITYTDTDSYH